MDSSTSGLFETMNTNQILTIIISSCLSIMIVFVLYKSYKAVKELLKMIDSFFGNINR